LLESRLAPATHTWTGASTTSSNWSDNANWTGGAPTNSEPNVVLIFPAAAQRANTDDITNLTVDSITFSANDYVIGGSPTITLKSFVTADAGVTTTDALNVNLTLSTDPQPANITVSAGGAALRLGGVINGSRALNKDGSGTLLLAAANTSYRTMIAAGTLQ